MSLTSQLDPVAKPELKNVRSMMELVPALENVGFVPDFSSTRSSAAKVSSSAYPLAFVRGEHQCLSIKIPGNYDV